jgi:Guanylate-binding protein, N-terminal domain
MVRTGRLTMLTRRSTSLGLTDMCSITHTTETFVTTQSICLCIIFGTMFNRLTGRSSAAQAAQQGAGQPLELVRYDERSKSFQVGDEALDVLRGIRAPMGVVSVCGRARQGKSFILNQLLGRSSGFVVAPTHRPCTKGLWMWSSPVERTGPDGSKYYLVRVLSFL